MGKPEQTSLHAASVSDQCVKSVNISLVSGPGLAFRIINWDELTFGPWVSPFPLIYIPFNIGERVRAWITLRASGSDPQTIIKTYESEWNTYTGWPIVLY